MIGRMDRYVGWAVTEAYVASALSFFSIAVLFDLLANLGEYVRNGKETLHLEALQLAPLLAEFYAYLVPALFLTFAPYMTVLACMFAVTKLTAANELVPMIFSGRSMFRVLCPAMWCALLSGLGMAATWEWYGPVASERFNELKDILKEGKPDSSAKNVLVRGGEAGEQVLRCARYLPEARAMEGVLIYDRGDNADGGPSIVRAERADWDAARSVWTLTKGTREHGIRIAPLPELAIKGVEPDTVWRLSRGAQPEHVQLLGYSELVELRALRPGRHDLALAFHSRFTAPLSCLLLVLLTLPLAVHFERGSRIGRVIAAICICALYLVFDLACRNLGLRQFINPVVAAWTPSIVFGSLGALFYSGLRT